MLAFEFIAYTSPIHYVKGDVTTDSTGSPESSGTTTERAETIQPLQGPFVNIVVEKGNASIVVNNIPSIPFPPPSGADDNLQQK